MLGSTSYRHLAYDPTLGRLYLCDLRPGQERLSCYTHDPLTGGHVWPILAFGIPKYLPQFKKKKLVKI